MGHEFLSDILLLLAASIPIVVVLRRVALPPLAGFLVVGALLGPHALGWIRAEEEVEALAEIGVALLLFTVGLEFSLPRLLLLKRELFLGGSLQVLLTIAAVSVAGLVFGAPTKLALLFGFLAATSSTAVVLKMLADEQKVETAHGRVAVAILLFQDLAVIPLLLLVPMLGDAGGAGLGGLLLVLLKAIGAVIAVLLIARFGFSRAAAIVVRAGGRELFTLFTVLVALGAAWITLSLSLPLALGAFVAGLVISESEYSHQVVDEILPFRDVFNALFFVSVGMLFDARVLVEDPLPTLSLFAGLSLLKGGVLYGVAFLLVRSRRVAFLVAANLFQIGEFAFVLARQASSLGVLQGAHEQRFLAVAVLSMLVTPFVIKGATRWADRATVGPTPEPEGQANHGLPPVQVLIAGYGLTGQHVARVLAATSISYRIGELNADRVRSAAARGVPIVTLDINRADALMHAGLAGAKVFVVAINDPVATRHAVAHARRIAPATQVIVRTRFLRDTEELMRLGAHQVVPEEFETSVEIFGRVLRELHVPRGTIAVQTELIRREGYQLLRGPISELKQLEIVGEILASTAVDTLFVGPSFGSCGKTLAELDFRRRTGATVLSVLRNEEEIHGPGADLRLLPGDLLIVRGEHAELDRARDLIAGNATSD
ncbi:MAG: cation:proton antiporter [Planctomycetota bacterium]